LNGPPTEREIRLYYFTIKEVSEMLGVKENYVLQLVKNGRLAGAKHFEEWFVRPGEIANYRMKLYETRLRTYHMSIAA
jgi:hypothetical protein